MPGPFACVAVIYHATTWKVFLTYDYRRSTSILSKRANPNGIDVPLERIELSWGFPQLLSK